jgi:hypothetical protein
VIAGARLAAIMGTPESADAVKANSTLILHDAAEKSPETIQP